MKGKIVEIGKELYDDLNALYHTEDGTSNKYDIKMDKSGVLKFIELFADRITKFYSAGEEVSDCTTCKYFISFRDDYFGDEYEPEEYGRCKNTMSHLYGNQGAGEGEKCDHYNPILTRPTVSEEEIKNLWYEHGGYEHYGELLNLMSYEDFKAAIKELLNR